ncbi:hypothetical protein VTO42DRAFT_5551 [Malbranchea cinnamomea]
MGLKLSKIFNLIPSNPEEVMVIRQITPSIITCSVPFSRYGIIKVGGRGTIVRLQTGSIAVFSPVALTGEVKNTINALDGTVKYLVALDIEHHIFLSQWKSEYPRAEIIGPHGLREKREKRPETRGVEITHILTPENRAEFDVSEEFDEEFDLEYVYMHPNREIVALHKPSRTLIEADLMFNLPAMEQYSRSGGGDRGLLTKLFGSAMSASGNSSIWQQRFLWHFASAPDRDEFKRSMARIFQWDFDRIIPCHGEVIETGGKDVFRKLFDWFLP